MILREEFKIRLMAGIEEIMSNGCLICAHDKECNLPCHGKAACNKPCQHFVSIPYGDGMTLMFKRYFPEFDWDEKFKDVDWDMEFVNMVPLAFWLKRKLDDLNA